MRTKSDYEKKRRKKGGGGASLEKRESPGKHTHTRFFLPRSTSDTARTKRVPPMKRFFTTVRAPRNKESRDCGAFAETERKDAKVESLSLSLSLSLLSRQIGPR